MTHDQEEALEVANRVVVMDKGRIEQIGTPADVYDNPRTAFVHGFIGESIVLPVEVHDGVVRLGDTPLNIAAERGGSGPSKLFVRRHDMQISAPGWGGLEGTVRRVRTFGPIQRADIALSGSRRETVIEIDAPRDRELRTRRDRRSAAPALPHFRGFSLRSFTFQPRLLCNNGGRLGEPRNDPYDCRMLGVLATRRMRRRACTPRSSRRFISTWRTAGPSSMPPSQRR